MSPVRVALPAEIVKAIARQEARERRRQQQQGLGRPIISNEFQGYRFVAVGDSLLWSRTWRTFHDFLFSYIKHVFGHAWGEGEQKKPLPSRHILLRWADTISNYLACQARNSAEEKIHSSPATPVLFAYLGLSYNLYLLRHNAKLQKLLLQRLKARDESAFHGAYYETFVAATFIKAGFDIEFEDEADGSATHCEFVATSRQSGKKYSVEAKSRFRPSSSSSSDAARLKPGVRDKLEAALTKRADHERVVFIDINLPVRQFEDGRPSWSNDAISEIRDVENTRRVSGQARVDAYVIVTNHPYQYEDGGGLSVAADGFNIPDFRFDREFESLRAALQARDRHADIFGLIQSMKGHYEIPSTFDGDIPEFALDEAIQHPRLRIGERYAVPISDGVERIGELVTAAVNVNEKSVYGVYALDDGQQIVATSPLTDAEMAAYRRYPDTFFDSIDRNRREAKDMMDLYDFFFDTYRNTAKDKLLEFMKDSTDIEHLRDLPQDELARTYCERLAYWADARRSQKKAS